MTHGHPTQSSHQHGPHSGADPHADCGHDHRGGVHVHNHAPKDFGFAFALGTALNVGFVVLEAAAMIVTAIGVRIGSAVRPVLMRRLRGVPGLETVVARRSLLDERDNAGAVLTT